MIVAETFTLAPDPSVIIWVIVSTIYLVAATAALVICLLKGRWGFALLGLFTAGLGAIVGSFLSPKPGSVWAKRATRQRAFGRPLDPA